MKDKNQYFAWLLLLLLSLIWGSSFILIKRGLGVFSAGEVGAVRILSAALFLLPLAIIKIKGLSRKHIKFLFIVGLSGSFIPAFLFAIAQTHLKSSLAGVLNALTPMFTMMVGAFVFKQGISKRVGVGLLIGFVGSVILILGNAIGNLENFNFYALLVVLATVFYAVNVNFIKFRIGDLNAETITAVSLLLVGPIAATYLFFFSDFITHLKEVKGAYLALGYLCILGVVGTALALIIFNHLVKITSPIFTSSVTYIIPLIAVCWGLIDGENLFLMHYLGMFFILFGVYMTNKQ